MRAAFGPLSSFHAVRSPNPIAIRAASSRRGGTIERALLEKSYGARNRLLNVGAVAERLGEHGLEFQPVGCHAAFSAGMSTRPNSSTSARPRKA
jgi:hypothetical protein